MCGIFCYIRHDQERDINLNEILQSLKHRGPDDDNVCQIENVGIHLTLIHTRLAIVDRSTGLQPFTWKNNDCQYWLIVNGEIYNHVDLRQLICRYKYQFCTKSDCEIILPLYMLFGIERTLSLLKGQFSIILFEQAHNKKLKLVAARDPFGIKPLFCMLNSSEIVVSMASEMKSLPNFGEHYSVCELSAGCYLCIDFNQKFHEKPYFKPLWMEMNLNALPCKKRLADHQPLRDILFNAVKTRLMTDEPKVGILLSGGLDSSLIAAIANKVLDRSKHGLYTFTISYDNQDGGEQTPQDDALCALQVSRLLGSYHYSYSFSMQDVETAIKDVVWSLETFDAITIRAAVPMFLLAKFAAADGIKVVLCGEGADELFAGYSLFNELRENSTYFSSEQIRRLALIGGAELLRVDRCTMAFGIEARVPFLDIDFVNYVMDTISIEDKSCISCIEKYPLRCVFDDLLPENILYRRKVEFSTGVGSEWIISLQRLISSQHMNEGTYYKKVFCELFGEKIQHVVQVRHKKRRSFKINTFSITKYSNVLFSKNGWNVVSTDPLLGSLVTLKEVHYFLEVHLHLTVAFIKRIKPSLKTLNLLIAQMLTYIPFQNLTILLKPYLIPTVEEIKSDMLSGIGGGCIVIQTFFGCLLSKLGYNVAFIPASIHQEHCHIAILALLKGKLYFIDVGNAKPYFEAVALNDDSIKMYGRRKWRLTYNKTKRMFELYHMRSAEKRWYSSLRFSIEKTVHFSYFTPMLQKSRSDPTFGPFLSSFRLCRFDSKYNVLAIKDGEIIEGINRKDAIDVEMLMDFIKLRFSELRSVDCLLSMTTRIFQDPLILHKIRNKIAFLK